MPCSVLYSFLLAYQERGHAMLSAFLGLSGGVGEGERSFLHAVLYIASLKGYISCVWAESKIICQRVGS